MAQGEEEKGGCERACFHVSPGGQLVDSFKPECGLWPGWASPENSQLAASSYLLLWVPTPCPELLLGPLCPQALPFVCHGQGLRPHEIWLESENVQLP